MVEDRTRLNEDTQDSVVPQEEGIRWADYMFILTPIEQKSNGMWYKREDKFAPQGINGINGSKCRQLLHLFEERPEGVDTVVHATNINSSPQTCMAAAMAEHYGLRCIQIAGGASLKSINSHELPLFATLLGTEYEIGSKSGFNKNLQKRVEKVMGDFENSFTIERDITLDHKLPENTPDKILAFHNIGAYQTKNFPDFIEDLILPFGSANSATSVLLGLSRDKPKSLKRIHLVNVGVDKREYMFERLELMGADISNYEIIWHDTKQPYSKTIKNIQIDDITFHYRYEAKVVDYILKNVPELINDKTLFWIIGSVPDLKTTAENLGREIPKSVKLYEFEEKFNLEEDEFTISKKSSLDDWEENYILIKRDNVEEPTIYYFKGSKESNKITFLNLFSPYDIKIVKSKKYNKELLNIVEDLKLVIIGDTIRGCEKLSKEEILYTLFYIRNNYKDYDIILSGNTTSNVLTGFIDELVKQKDFKVAVVFFNTEDPGDKNKSLKTSWDRAEKSKELYKGYPIELYEVNNELENELFEKFLTKNLDKLS